MFDFGFHFFNSSRSSTPPPPPPSPDFIIKVKTDNSGLSGNNQFRLPCFGGGYDFTATWDNGDTTTHTGSPGNITFTRPTVGEHTLTISGTFPTIRFNFEGDRLKLIEIINFGDVGWASMERAFLGCANMVVAENATGVFNGVTNFLNAFRTCTSMKTFPALDLSSGTNFQGAWQANGSMMSFATRNFYNINNGTNAFNGTTLPTSDYSDILVTQRANNNNNNVTFNGGTSKYNPAGGVARAELTDTVVNGGQNWSITDGGAE